MRLTKQTGHAIRILIDCAQAGGELVKIAEIAGRLDLTKQNAFKIVHILSRAGFLSAVRGPGGGVKLAQDPRKIRVGDVVRAIEVTDVSAAAGKPLLCDRGPTVNTLFDDAMMAFISVLDQHTLADLAAGAAKPPETSAKLEKTGAATRRAKVKPVPVSARRL